MSDATITASCCAPVFDGALDVAQADRLAAAFKLLADPVRLRLLSLIASAEGPVCTCDLTEPTGRSQPTVSHHLGALTEAGLLTREKRGRNTYYAVQRGTVELLRDALRV